MPMSETPTPAQELPRSSSIEQPVAQPQLILTIRPSLLAAIILRLIIAAILIGVTVGALLIANRLVGFDIITFVLQAARDAAANLQAEVPEFATFLQQVFAGLGYALTAIAVLVAVVVLLRALPLVTKRWKLYEDRLEYSQGLLFVREQQAPLAALALIGSKRALPLIDIGSITIVLSGSNQPIVLPMVLGADEKAERIRTVQRAAQAGWMGQRE